MYSLITLTNAYIFVTQFPIKIKNVTLILESFLILLPILPSIHTNNHYSDFLNLLYISFAYYGTSYKWNFKMGTLEQDLFLLLKMFLRFIHIVAYICSSFLLLCSIPLSNACCVVIIMSMLFLVLTS